jgi:hypothetical protein
MLRPLVLPFWPFSSLPRSINPRTGSDPIVNAAWTNLGLVALSSAAASIPFCRLSRRNNLRAKGERSVKQRPCALPMFTATDSRMSSLRHTTWPRVLKSHTPPLRKSMVTVSSSVRPFSVKTRAPVSDKSATIPSLATAWLSNMLIRTGSAGAKRGKRLPS